MRFAAQQQSSAPHDSLPAEPQSDSAATVLLVAAPDSGADSAGSPLESILPAPQPFPPALVPFVTVPDTPIAPPAIQQETTIPKDLIFIGLLFALFVVPKALQRYRIPGAITSLVMGATASMFGWLHHDPTLQLLSTFGIVALFLFAGLEINVGELRRNSRALAIHSIVWLVLVSAATYVGTMFFHRPVRVSALIALALMTPSAGFILSSLPGFGLNKDEQFSVKTSVVGSELLALGMLFFILQSTSLEQLLLSLAAMVGVVIVIPVAFRAFAHWVVPHAPRSEFAFLLMIAVVSAYTTRRLGVYYLVGAFIVGVAAQQFRSRLPAMSSEKMIDALESFGSVFIPFYFFYAGTEIIASQLTWISLLIGVALLVVCVPLRVGATMLSRRFITGDSMETGKRIGNALIPTLVFTLVISSILQENFALPDAIVGALVLYTVLNTTIPAFVLHSAAPDFESVEVSPVGPFPKEPLASAPSPSLTPHAPDGA